MKTFTLFSFLVLLFVLPCKAGEITPAEAKSHIGQVVTVRGTVDQVKVSAKAIFLDFGGRYPNQAFVVVTFNTAFADVLSAYEGKTISVNGKVELYRGKPEIILHSLAQISK